MNSQSKYKDEIIKKLQDIPDEDMSKLLEIIYYLKTSMKESKKKVRVEKGKDSLFDLRKVAVETGIKDLAEHHDHYLYGVSK